MEDREFEIEQAAWMYHIMLDRLNEVESKELRAKGKEALIEAREKIKNGEIDFKEFNALCTGICYDYCGYKRAL